MEEKDFVLLETLDKTKNITRAADQLFVTQSTLSKRVNAIENELGVALMLRSHQGIRFTPEGEVVLKHIREAARELQAMREYLETTRDYISGTVTVGISINYAHYYLPDLLAAFRSQYPKVTIHIVTDQSRKLFLMIMNNSVDIAIVRGEYPWKKAKVLLARENICAISSSDDCDRPLSEIPYIGRKTDAVFERELAQWMRENNLRPEEHGIYVDSIETCVEMVKRGLGWAIVPEICLNDFPGEIRKLSFANGEPFVRSTYLLYSDDVAKLPQVNAFIETVKKG